MTVDINGWAYSWDDDRPRRRLNSPVSAEKNEHELNKEVAERIHALFVKDSQKGLKTEVMRNYRARKKINGAKAEFVIQDEPK